MTNNTPQTPALEAELAKHKKICKIARSNLLLLVIFTVVNSVMLWLGKSYYFLFSAAIPYMFISTGLAACGYFPEEYYGDVSGIAFKEPTLLYIFATIASVILLMYLLTFFCTKKGGTGWFVLSVILFLIDTGFLFFVGGFSVDMIIDYVFHIWALVYLFRGLISSSKINTIKTQMDKQGPYPNGFSYQPQFNDPNHYTAAVREPIDHDASGAPIEDPPRDLNSTKDEY